jgi:hypothetical protein
MMDRIALSRDRGRGAALGAIALGLLLNLVVVVGCSEAPSVLAADGGAPDQELADTLRADGRAPGREAAAPDAKTPSPDTSPTSSTRPAWILHLTDLHVGASTFATTVLETALDGILPAVSPTLTVVSGDIANTGAASEYKVYAGLIAAATSTLSYPTTLEIPGNHDFKSDDGQSFLAGTLTGLAGAGLDGLSYIDGPAGRVRVIRTNTADSEIALLRLAGYFSESQQTALLALPPSKRAVVYTIATGHHPLKGLQGLQVFGTDKRMEDVLSTFQASVYLCGHLHSGNLSWDGSTLVVQTATLGEPSVLGGPGFAVVGLDETGPSARLVDLSQDDPPTVDWPIVLVTTPADAALGGTNPYAGELTPSSAVAVRALGFAPSGLQSVRARFDSGSWTSLVAVDKVLWQATLTAPASSGKSAKHTLEVEGTSAEGTDTVKLTVVVGK